MEHYRDILHEHLNQKKSSNPKFSLRLFAKRLDISHSRLSMILNGQRGLSLDAAKSIADKLELIGSQKILFELTAQAESARSTKEKNIALEKIKKVQSCNNFKTLDKEDFKIISEWQYFAILELINTKDFQHDLLWIANRLGIHIELVRDSVERLRSKGMLKVEDNKFYITDQSFTTTNEIPSQAIRDYHKSVLKKAGKAVDAQPTDNRAFATLTIGISKERLPEIKELIRKQRRELNQLVENIPVSERDSVYMLSSQFFELTES